ncbi:hypothetical protein [Paraflavitalea speifideaquila]|uniref:hypothetical protein n=1 Tax=Paraflavitalea speifideaquila TaxID=3076558 RepID=UPI0028E8136E|nr:hypothetical protein [Paraflavitalea speifideiaquila]
MPIIDSLPPFVVTRFGADYKLTRKEIREIKRQAQDQKGLKLNEENFNGGRFIPAAPILAAFKDVDSVSFKIIGKQKPFYMISMPVFLTINAMLYYILILLGPIVLLTFLKKGTRVDHSKNHSWLVRME